MDGNAKHDLEHTAEKSVSMSAKISKISTILFGRFLIVIIKNTFLHL